MSSSLSLDLSNSNLENNPDIEDESGQFKTKPKKIIPIGKKSLDLYLVLSYYIPFA